ncbi:hypothetical protein [Nocardia sp. CC227C]|uniref:hypothetical protein n=1 Tax=Nocardia sp. CC227C TaxID=3044562 RepID=UPI00278BD041|nr:hypothetical protein [Nocardia sp. CC227C]
MERGLALLIAWFYMLTVGLLILLPFIWPYLLGSWVASEGFNAPPRSTPTVVTGIVFEVPWLAYLAWGSLPLKGQHQSGTASPHRSDLKRHVDVNPERFGMIGGGLVALLLLAAGITTLIGEAYIPEQECRTSERTGNQLCRELAPTWDGLAPIWGALAVTAILAAVWYLRPRPNIRKWLAEWGVLLWLVGGSAVLLLLGGVLVVANALRS